LRKPLKKKKGRPVCDSGFERGEGKLDKKEKKTTGKFEKENDGGGGSPQKTIAGDMGWGIARSHN